MIRERGGIRFEILPGGPFSGRRFCVINNRLGTRVSCEIPLTLMSLDAAHPSSAPRKAILVNLQGCAAQFGFPLKIGTAVQLDDLPEARKVYARVVNCFWPGEFAKFWDSGTGAQRA